MRTVVLPVAVPHGTGPGADPLSWLRRHYHFRADSVRVHPPTAGGGDGALPSSNLLYQVVTSQPTLMASTCHLTIFHAPLRST